jgi:hypothetical protein
MEREVLAVKFQKDHPIIPHSIRKYLSMSLKHLFSENPNIFYQIKTRLNSFLNIAFCAVTSWAATNMQEETFEPYVWSTK